MLVFSCVNESLFACAKLRILGPHLILAHKSVWDLGTWEFNNHLPKMLWCPYGETEFGGNLALVCVRSLSSPPSLHCLLIVELPTGKSAVSTVHSLNHFQIASATLASRRACVGPEGGGLGKQSDTWWCQWFWPCIQGSVAIHLSAPITLAKAGERA